MFIRLFLLFILFFVSSCSHNHVNTISGSDVEIYEKALLSKNKKEQIELYEQLETMYPYSKYIPQAKIHKISLYFDTKKYTDVISEADDFLMVYPAHEKADYINYLKADSYYKKIKNHKHELDKITNALLQFNKLIESFPDSIYINKAKEKVIILSDIMAANYVYIGNFYMKRGNIVAAVNRYRDVTILFPETKHYNIALEKLEFCLKKLSIS